MRVLVQHLGDRVAQARVLLLTSRAPQLGLKLGWKLGPESFLGVVASGEGVRGGQSRGGGGVSRRQGGGQEAGRLPVEAEGAGCEGGQTAG